MAKTTKTIKDKLTKDVSLMPDNPENPKPRLKKLIIKNFRTIGEVPVEIDLDEIVILVGANNAGKSSILRAYEVVMNNGSKEGKITIEDFPNNTIDPAHLPEIEVHTIISEDKPGEQWIQYLNDRQMQIRERWIWAAPGEPKREGFDVAKGEWSDKRPWGAPNVAKAYRPMPHRIDAFSSPEEQEKAITKMVSSIINDRVKTIQENDNTEEGKAYKKLIRKIAEFQNTVCSLTYTEVHEIEKSISDYLGRVFVNYVIKINTNPEKDVEKTYSPFTKPPDILVGPENGYKSSVSVQGSGTRRTLMWAALKYIQEHADENTSRPHVLLLDEPEVCLHPSAIREAREVLYDLSRSPNWQVMITTHSPIFIDLSRDNTTIIRVEKNQRNEVISTTLYRPDNTQLSDDEKENLKLLNVCDPYLHEFFFGGRVIIVEGDTEYTAFSYLKMMDVKKYGDVHIVRARGKTIIPSLCKILNQFACPYAILHDADTEKTVKGTKNPAWIINQSIMDAAKNSNPNYTENIAVIACKKNFEDALFGFDVSSDKPYNTIQQMKSDVDKYQAVMQLFDSLLDASVVDVG